jgi:hypothetical protein
VSRSIGGWLMEASEVIALVAVLVTGIGAVVTGISVWLNYRGSDKRLDHEERMLEKKLAHNRREASRAEAAKAYRLCTEAERKLNWYEVERQGYSGAGQIDGSTKLAVLAAADAMELARAYGWNDAVVDAAGKVLVELANLENRAFATVGLVGGGRNSEDVREEFQRVYDKYDAAIEAYRVAISE